MLIEIDRNKWIN